jgi:hypothetical protein
MSLNNCYVRIVLSVGIVAILLSIFTPPFGQGPDEWLIEWTEWAAEYVAVAVAAYGIVKIADGVAYRLTVRSAEKDDGKAESR